MTMELRGYQQDCIQSARIALSQGRRRIAVYGPTGCGKSVVITAMAESAVRKGKRVAFLANRKILVNQIQTHFHRQGIDFGVLQADNTRRLDAPVISASIDTVHVRGLPDVDVLLIDECHAVPGSKKYRELLFRYNNVPAIGFSATPFSAGMARPYDELKGPLFEELVVAATIPELQADGHLCRLDAYAPATPDLTGVKTKTDAYGERDYVESDLAQAMDQGHLVGGIIEHWFRLAPGRKTVCFACSIPHSKHIVAQFRSNGVPAVHLDCYMPDEEREAILRDYALGKYRVISCVSLLAEGFDDPATEVMILARPTKSLIRYIQMVGRIIRPFPGKDRALLIDHSGTVLRLGFPDDDLPLFLDDGKPKTSQSKPKDEVLPKECAKCHFLKPAKVHACPACGFAPERQAEAITVQGTLHKVKRKAKQELTTEQRLAFYAELRWIGRERGYAEGWASNQYRERFGVWPASKPDPKEPAFETEQWVRSRLIRYAKGRQKGAAAIEEVRT